jgi:hypothetical protein
LYVPQGSSDREKIINTHGLITPEFLLKGQCVKKVFTKYIVAIAKHAASTLEKDTQVLKTVKAYTHRMIVNT